MKEAVARRGRGGLGVVFTAVLLDLIGFGIVLPLLPFFATELGASPLEVGMIVGSYSAMQFLFSPLWGRLSDRVGRRLPLVVGLAGSAASYVIFALARTTWVLLVSRVVAGAMGATVAVAQAYIADSTTLERRARGMGLIGVAFGLGFIIGPAIGGALSRWGFVVAGYAAAVASLAAAVAAWLLLPGGRPAVTAEVRSAEGAVAGPGAPRGAAAAPKGAARPGARRLGEAAAVLVRPALRGPILAFFTATVGFAAYTTTFPLFLESPLGLTAAHAGGFFALAGLCSVVFQGGLVGPLAERAGEARVSALGAGVLGAGLLLLGWLEGVLAAAVLVAVVGAGWGLLAPSLQSLVSRRAGAAEQGGVLGVNQSLSSLGRVIGPVLGGWAFGAFGHGWAFGGAGALLLGTATAAWGMRNGARDAQ